MSRIRVNLSIHVKTGARRFSAQLPQSFAELFLVRQRQVLLVAEKDHSALRNFIRIPGSTHDTNCTQTHLGRKLTLKRKVLNMLVSVRTVKQRLQVQSR
jgi:hypothetical protein